jgi:hypothetical protein
MKLTKRSFAGAALSAAGSLFVLGSREASAEPHHSHIHSALESLRDARSDLKDSHHDYGKHRDEAMRAIDEAIHQLEIIERWEHDHR